MKPSNLDSAENVLPFEGCVNYLGPIINSSDVDMYFNELLSTIEWKNDEAKIFGKHIITKRKAAWYGDQNFDYTYSGTTKKALEWTSLLLEIKRIVESKCGVIFNSCLLNLYHDGNEGMAWHSDDEKELGKDTVIASFSLGAERRFLFRHKITKETVQIILENGSLLVMRGKTQTHWLHSLPKAAKIKSPRINLTFRTIITGKSKAY